MEWGWGGGGEKKVYQKSHDKNIKTGPYQMKKISICYELANYYVILTDKVLNVHAIDIT